MMNLIESFVARLEQGAQRHLNDPTQLAFDKFTDGLSARLAERESIENEFEAARRGIRLPPRTSTWWTLHRQVVQLQNGDAQVAFGTEPCPSLKDAPGCGPPIVIRHLKSGLIMTFPAYRSPSGAQAMITPHFRRHFTRVKTKPSFAATHHDDVLPVFSAKASEIEVSGQSYGGVLEAIERRVSSLLKTGVHLRLTGVECYGTGCSASVPVGDSNDGPMARSKWRVVCTLPCFFTRGEFTLCDSCSPTPSMRRVVVDDQDMFAKQYYLNHKLFELQPSDLCTVSWAMFREMPNTFADIQPVTCGTRVLLQYDVVFEGPMSSLTSGVFLPPPRFADFVEELHNVMTLGVLPEGPTVVGVPCTGRYASDDSIQPPTVPRTAVADGLTPLDDGICRALTHYCGACHVVRLLKVVDCSGRSSVYFLHRYPSQTEMGGMLDDPTLTRDLNLGFSSTMTAWNHVFRTVWLYPFHVSWVGDPASLSNSWTPIGGVGCTGFGTNQLFAQCFLSLAFLAVLPVRDPKCIPSLFESPPNVDSSLTRSAEQPQLMFPSTPTVATLLLLAERLGAVNSVAACSGPEEMVETLSFAVAVAWDVNRREAAENNRKRRR